MSLVPLPGLPDLIEEISVNHNLPHSAVKDALREALLKGYERFRRSQTINQPPFSDEYFQNFEVELDLEEEGFRILSTKKIVENVTNTDHDISLQEVQEVAG